MSLRLDGFQGTDLQYIEYLEHQIRTCRETHQASPDAPNSGLRATTITSPQPSTSPPSRKRSRHEGAVEDLQVVQWKAAAPRSQSVEKQWLDKARELVRLAPSASNWQRHITATGIFEVTSSGNATSFMLHLNNQYPMQQEMSDPNATTALTSTEEPLDLIGRLETYARTALTREHTAHIALILATFQKFLLLSACAVLYDCHDAKDRVLDVVRICLGDVSPRYCMRCLRAVKYVNRLVYMMDNHGWRSRTSELLMIWNKPVSWYVALADSPANSLEYLHEKLSKTEFTTDVVVSNNRLAIHIPMLIFNILGKRFEVSRIGEILGYNVHSFQQINPWQYFN